MSIWLWRTTVIAALVLFPSAGRAAHDDWKFYRNAATGLTFRYPPSLQVHEADNRRISIATADAVVELRFDGGRGQVMQFVVYHDAASAFQPMDDKCKPIRLGGQEVAFECVMCWPACMWAVEIKTPRLCSITSPYSTPPLQDGELPLRSIIESVHFEGNNTPAEPPSSTALHPSGGNLRDAAIYLNNRVTLERQYAEGSRITAYPIDANGDRAPLAVINVPHSSRGIAVDTLGTLYLVVDPGQTGGWPNISAFASQISASAIPNNIISGAMDGPTGDLTKLQFPNGIALDDHGNIYVTDDAYAVTHDARRQDSVLAYKAGSKDNAKPFAAIVGHDTGLSNPYGIALDSTGAIYVANFGSGLSALGSLTIYPPNSTGNVKPRAAIAGSKTALHEPSAIAIDCTHNIYVANYQGGDSELGSITVYAAGSDGDVAPIRTIEGAHTGLREPYGVDLDSDGNILVANYTGGPSKSGSITFYPPEANGDVAPTHTLAGPNTGIDHPWAIATRPNRCAGSRNSPTTATRP